MAAKWGEYMNRSEFAKIVNDVSHEELEKLNDAVRVAANADKDIFALMIAELATSIPAIAARTTADILVRSGLVQLEDD